MSKIHKIPCISRVKIKDGEVDLGLICTGAARIVPRCVCEVNTPFLSDGIAYYYSDMDRIMTFPIDIRDGLEVVILYDAYFNMSDEAWAIFVLG